LLCSRATISLSPKIGVNAGRDGDDCISTKFCAPNGIGCANSEHRFVWLQQWYPDGETGVYTRMIILNVQVCDMITCDTGKA
jgi:hypothetical protein